MNDFLKTCLYKVEQHNIKTVELGAGITKPKQYMIDCDKIQELRDLKLILAALCSTMTISEVYEDIDKIRHLLKEVE